MDEMDGALAKPRPVVDSDGSLGSEFDLCLHTIMVAQVDSRYLAAFPFSVWHRTVNKRVLDRSLLSRPALVEVGYCSLEDGSVAVDDGYMRIWMGYVTEEFYRTVEIAAEDEVYDHWFNVEGYGDALPFGPSLLEALQEHFAFLSAESAGGGKVHHAPGKGSGSAGLGARVTALETTLSSMSESLEKLTEHLGQKKSSKKVFIDPQATPMEDPLARAAANLVEMQRMLAKDPTGGKKLREPALRKTLKPTAKPQPSSVAVALSDSEDESEGDSPGYGSASNSSPTALTGTLDKLTEILTLLSQDKLEESQSIEDRSELVVRQVQTLEPARL